ncbi:MAG: hypothetical protein QM765_40710 [Myxococcales bacterium]
MSTCALCGETRLVAQAGGVCLELADLPNTSVQQARRCLRAARSAGWRRARISNRHVLAADESSAPQP